jgi:hypothetical protein
MYINGNSLYRLIYIYIYILRVGYIFKPSEGVERK